MSFAEFERIPDDGKRYELRHGELVEMPSPKHGHKLIEMRLQRLLEAPAGRAGIIGTEIGFRPRPDFEWWEADVAYVSRTRWDQIPREGWMEGAPELVIEVLSPSNTESEMRDRRGICLENGCVEFWVVDPKRGEVEVSTPDGHSVTYKSGQQVPLFFAPGAYIRVSAIFE